MTVKKKRILVPPIKSQGIKTKLVPMIETLVPESFSGRWIEPFMGTGVVGFNIAPGSTAVMNDANPHLINFYSQLNTNSITQQSVKTHLVEEGQKLLELGESYFYEVRARFNESHEPLDFLFLNRSCFNGMIRFNRKGGFNVPFCRKPNRFAQAYITKIYNQVGNVSAVLESDNFSFANAPFTETIAEARKGDLLYCDPPYIDRHADYFNGWTEKDEHELHEALSQTEASFILSTWSHNDFRRNTYLETIWSDFNVITRAHFYHVGANVENRRGMTEALVFSSDLSPSELATEVLFNEGEDSLVLF